MYTEQRATHWQVLAFIWRYVKRHSVLVVAMMLILIVYIALQLIQPFFYMKAVDTLALSEPGNTATYVFALKMVILGVLMSVLHLSLQQVSTLLLAWVETRVMIRAHADVFAYVQRLSTKFHVNTFAGSTARKIGRGSDAIESILDILWFNFLPLAVLTIGFGIVLLLFAPLIGIALVICMIVYVTISVSLSMIQMRYDGWVSEQDTKVTGSLVDSVSGNATVKSFGAEICEDKRHGRVLKEWRHRLWKTWKLSNVVTWLQYMMMAGIQFVVFFTGVLLWYRGEFTAGSFIVLISYIGRLWGSLYDIGKQVRNYIRAVTYTEEMVGLTQIPLGVSDSKTARKLNVPRGAIAFRDVNFAYEKQSRPIFQGFNLDIEAGERIALVGHSGGGKSTFVKLLQRLYDVQSGRITIDGQDISKVTQESLRKAIGLVPQDPILFHRSLAENIAYGRQNATQTEIAHAAKKAHAHEFIQSLPKGYDTLVGERGVKLSGGERQRVAIARAILADTPILILDEATSSLDSLSEQFIQEALDFLMQGRTTIVIAHRLSTIKKVDRILVIEGGNILEEGSHSALVRRKDGVYRHFFELQAGGFIGE